VLFAQLGSYTWKIEEKCDGVQDAEEEARSFPLSRE